VVTDYAATRIQEALRLSQGDTTKARTLLIEWTYTDPKLLIALAEPHLPGLVAYNIEQLGAGAANAPGKPFKTRKTKSGKGTNFGLGLLKAAVSARAEIFGLESPQASSSETKASQEHIDAIRKLAKKASKTERE
jgi:hypothetical protein